MKNGSEYESFHKNIGFLGLLQVRCHDAWREYPLQISGRKPVAKGILLVAGIPFRVTGSIRE